MCIRRETREKARRSLAFSRVSKPHTHIAHMLRQCTSIVYLCSTLLSHTCIPSYSTVGITPDQTKAPERIYTATKNKPIAICFSSLAKSNLTVSDYSRKSKGKISLC